ncbi:MAG: hypothetical protein EP344_07185 [Bacteroidetes bacterium]|nr:MAG: hypothetical protein EP344_07185 [Bacteroidota bacterium]
MAKLFSILLLCYVLAFAGVRLFIYAPGKDPGREPVRGAADLLDRSDRHDFKRLRMKGRVVQSGHFFWDLLLVPSYTFEANNGLRLQVFAAEAVPATGQYLTLVAVFRQYYKGWYGQWLGLVELERTYVETEDLAGTEMQ